MAFSLVSCAPSGAQSLADLHPETSEGSSDKLVLQLARSLHLGTWEGSLGTDYGTGRDRTRSDTGVDLAFARRHTAERMSLRNSGFSVINPELASGNLGLTFGLIQDHLSNNTGPPSALHAELIGYDFDTTFLGSLPYSGTVHANRSQSISDLPFGRIEMAYEKRGAALRLTENSPLRDWGYPFLSANMRVEQQHIKETSTSILGQSFRRDELRNTFSHDGHKGYETADLNWRYEFNDFQNPLSAQGTFRNQVAHLGYSLDFGPTLNRRWDSRLFYNQRSGIVPFSLFTADERLHVDHQANLATNYQYLLLRTETPAGTAKNQTGSFQVLYRPYQNLGSAGTAIRQDLPTGVRDTLAGQINYGAQRELPWSARLLTRASLGYALVDSRLNASQNAVNDEQHAAPSPLGAGAGFLLDQPFVATSSIVVVDTRGGTRLPATPGIDYETVAEGDSTRVIPLATSAVIQAGDPLEVSYAYRLDPSLKYSTASGSAGATVNFRWMTFSVDHQQSGQKALSGVQSQFLQNVRNDTARLELRGAWDRINARAGAEAVRYNSTRIIYAQQRYYESGTYRPTRNFSLNLNVDRTLTDYTLPSRQSDTRTMQLTAEWVTQGGWTTSGLLGRRVLKDSVLPMETVNEAGLRARLVYGKLLFTSAFTVNDRVRGGFQMNNWRLDFNATRSF